MIKKVFEIPVANHLSSNSIHLDVISIGDQYSVYS